MLRLFFSGPGCGKGTQCAKLAQKYNFIHMSAGDLLREERDSGSPYGDLINSYMNEGRMVPNEITVRLLKQAIERHSQEKRPYLIDGFPRTFDNLQGWDAEVASSCDLIGVVFFDANEDVMTERIMARALTSGRVDDNIETLKKRFALFREESMPVITRFAREGKVITINACQTQQQVFDDVSKALLKLV